MNLRVTSPAVGSTTAGGAGRLDPALLRLGIVLSLAAVLAGLDATIVNVGIDSVAADLGGPLATVQWISTGYLLAVSMVIPLAGWASERFGARRMWLVSVALFVAGSALCAAAPSTGALIVFRILQGIGGGMMQPIGQSVIVRAAGRERLARVMAVVTLPVMLAPVVGPVLGGVIVSNLDWRWMFLVNVPVGIATLAVATRVLPRTETPAAGARLDRLGLALLSPGVAALVYGLASVADAGPGSARVLVALGAGTALLAGYVAHALTGRGTPLIDLRLFARRGFTVATTNSFLSGATLYSSMLLLPLYYQQVQHASALQAGLLLAPQAVGTAAVTYFAGRLSDRIGPRPLVLGGILLVLLGTVAFTQLGAAPPTWLLTASLVVRGVGQGMVMTPGMAAVYGSVSPAEAPRAASALNVLNRVGGSLGTAILVVVLQRNLSGAALPAAAFGHTFGWALALSALSIAPALFYPRRRQSR